MSMQQINSQLLRMPQSIKFIYKGCDCQQVDKLWIIRNTHGILEPLTVDSTHPKMHLTTFCLSYKYVTLTYEPVIFRQSPLRGQNLF